jgi:putative transposase
MPRTARVLIDRAYYHVLNRGLDKRPIFRRPGDFDFFHNLAVRCLEKFNVQVFHYCLMPNHFHLLLQASSAQHLPKFIHNLTQNYAGYFAGRYKTAGVIFQNRYKSRLIAHESYLLACARYIERNPLAAELVEDISKWKWSSYRYYAMGEDDPLIKRPHSDYISLSEDEEGRKMLFKKFVEEENPFDDLIDKVFKFE